MTNHWEDIKNADLVLVMGGNAAEAHPVGFKWAIEAKLRNKARLICVDPRFTRTASVADYYAPLRAGSDIAFLGGVVNYLLSNNKIQTEYVRNYTNAAFIVGEGYTFDDGIFSGYDPEKRKYDNASWTYEKEGDFAKVDNTMEHPRCVLQLMKQHYSRYTPEVVEQICGTPKEKFLKVAEEIASTSTPNRVMTILYALGWAQHSYGSQIIRTAAIVQLLLGNMGMLGGGVNALRGHSNIQGLTDLGLLSTNLPGYLSLPKDAEQDLQGYLDARATKPLRPGQMSYWQNYPKFFVSMQKAWWGDAATAENQFAYHYLPKYDKMYDILNAFEMMNQGKLNGYFCQGFNPVASFPNKKKIIAGLSKLKFLVTMDPLNTETAEFWKNYGEHNDVDTASIQTTVFRLPTTCFAEEDGSITNSSRWLQWHWKGANGPGESRPDIEIIAGLFTRLRDAYRKEGGAYPDPIVNLDWKYRVPHAPTSEELAREYNGKALVDLVDPANPTAPPVAKAGEQLSSFGQLRDDGTTASGCWIYTGAWTQAGNMMARRDNSDPYDNGQTPNWAWAWPANRRILYNAASCDPTGKPWDAKRRLIWWNGSKWVGSDVPDIKADANPNDPDRMMPFIMTGEGTGRMFAPSGMADGPLPEHFEPFETPLDRNPMHPNNPKAKSNPAARVFKNDMEAFGKPEEFPYVATSYRLTEHFHYWTKHAHINAVLQPEQFVEISPELAKIKGINNGDRVKVSSNRGFIKAVAVVTKRIPQLTCDGKTINTVGLPNHWGFLGVTRPGYLVNTLTPFVGDANTQTPEYKSFTVNIEKI